MITSLHHRGPDESGFHDGDGFALGHARLSIIGLDNGSQPLLSADGHRQLVANGEIYNYRTLRESLGCSQPFHTDSDCETILNGYAEHGTQAFSQMNGMYAFLLADNPSSVVHCAVDPVGIKPLYVYESPDLVIAASELRAVVAGLRELGHPVRLNEAACDVYLRQGWFPAEASIIEGVHRLRPGELLTIDAELNVERSVIRHISADVSDRLPPTLDELEDAITAAVRRQLVADVPLGFFLSGGIDSSLLTAMAAKDGHDINTFTVDFVGSAEADQVSEAKVARMVADKLGCTHHELKVDAETLLQKFDAMFECLDEPLADPAILPLMVLSAFAREHVKVCLSGDGGDELFAGYLRHAIAPCKPHFDPSGLPHRLLKGVSRRTLGLGSGGKLSRILQKSGRALDMLNDNQFVYGPFAGVNADWLTHVRVPSATGEQAKIRDLFQRELAGPLPGQMLTKTDRGSMWNSLEVRVPLLDLELIQTALAIPQSEKRSFYQGKRHLRQLLSRFLPAEITERKKHGFRVPVSTWFRNELRGRVESGLIDNTAIPESIISAESVAAICREHFDGHEHGIRVWSLLALNESIRRLQLTWRS